MHREIIACTCKKNVCELITLLVTNSAVVTFYQRWRNPEWTKCSVHFCYMYLYMFKIRLKPCTISELVTFRNRYVCGWLVFKYVCALDACTTLLRRVVNQSLHFLIISFQYQFPISIRLVFFFLKCDSRKTKWGSTLIIITLLLGYRMQISLPNFCKATYNYIVNKPINIYFHTADHGDTNYNLFSKHGDGTYVP